jgi:hypothetical protein
VLFVHSNHLGDDELSMIVYACASVSSVVQIE